MSFFVNVGNVFSLNPAIQPDGCIILAGNIPSYQLERRHFNKFPSLKNRMFDPQLYLSGLDPSQTPEYCSNLSTYSWFGANSTGKYDSKQHKQRTWMQNIKKDIVKTWRRGIIDYRKEPDLVRNVIRDCIDFQLKIGVMGIILPSPLTYDPNSDYSTELFWLDAALSYIKKRGDIVVPVYATIALTDNCLLYTEPSENQLLELILDTIGAREVDGVYILIEQRSESEYTRHISNSLVLQSALHLTYLFKEDLGFNVGVNFFGFYGLALEAVGADFWASGWYKSRYRFRLADKVGEGRAFPSCWSSMALVDIHLENEFDLLWNSGFVYNRVDVTDAAQSLLDGAAAGKSSNQIPAWEHRMSNVTASQEHFLESACAMENLHRKIDKVKRMNFVTDWLQAATADSALIQTQIGSTGKTQTKHVQAWAEAFRLFRLAHSL